MGRSKAREAGKVETDTGLFTVGLFPAAERWSGGGDTEGLLDFVAVISRDPGGLLVAQPSATNSSYVLLSPAMPHTVSLGQSIAQPGGASFAAGGGGNKPVLRSAAL